MKKLLALALSLCLALAGCAQSAPTPRAEDGGAAPVPSAAPVAAESFEKLALGLPALPTLPEEPDEAELWERLSDASDEEQEQIWNEYDAQATAYREAVDALRGSGVDAALTPAFAAYTLRAAQQLMSGAAEENLVWSPANLYLALCMLAETTDGESRAQVLDLLGLTSVEQARGAAASLWRALYEDSETGKTLLANSLWLNEQFDYRQEVVDTLADSHFAATFRAAMGAQETDEAIHAWINENTNGLLADAAGGLKTSPDTLLMLISTLYFKGTWSDQFDASATSEDTFTSARGEKQTVEFMHKTESGTYYRGDGYTVAALPFRDGTSMWFLLPDEGVSVQSLLPDVSNLSLAICGEEDAVQDTEYGPFVARRGYADIRWSVPKFDVDSDLDLIPALEALGVQDVFGENADFSPLTDLDALVSAVQHAARVTVDEEGCEAAAFTAITMETTSALVEPLPIVEMDLSRPFGFLITGADGLPLFMSVVNTLA